MNKQSNNIVHIKYKPGDLIRDRYGEIARIVKANGSKSSIRYLGTKYDSDVSMWYILENYVPCAFQEGDLVRFKSDIIKITGILRSERDGDYYYEVRCKGLTYFESVKDIDTYGEYKESKILQRNVVIN